MSREDRDDVVRILAQDLDVDFEQERAYRPAFSKYREQTGKADVSGLRDELYRYYNTEFRASYVTNNGEDPPGGLSRHPVLF